ncbi:DUF5988 family protein [Kitasatospora sp. SUK 42]|uniref:DUF5988 family protein n=1 Tax=Kitasatospora sp. SUK 42 TaxID=1588882 RepID=UPI0035ABC059
MTPPAIGAVAAGLLAAGLPEHERLRFPDTEQHVLKLPRTVRYEHFRRSQRTVGHRREEPWVFEQTGSTAVAERTTRSGPGTAARPAVPSWMSAAWNPGRAEQAGNAPGLTARMARAPAGRPHGHF